MVVRNKAANDSIHEDTPETNYLGAATPGEYFFEDKRGKLSISKNLAISAYSTYTGVVNDALKQLKLRYEALGRNLREGWQSDAPPIIENLVHYEKLNREIATRLLLIPKTVAQSNMANSVAEQGSSENVSLL